MTRESILFSNLSSPVSDVTPEVFRTFLGHVVIDTDTGCWNWLGSVNRDGYGQISFMAYVNGREWNGYLAHRLSYTLFRGPLVKGLEIDHLCRNRSCVAPSHLEQVPHRTNSQRAYNYRMGVTFLQGFDLGVAL